MRARPTISSYRFVALVAATALLGSTGLHASGYPRPRGKLEMVSVSSGGRQANGESGTVCSGEWSDSSISADGRYVAFHSRASNLDNRDTNGSLGDVFVHDRRTHKTQLASITTSGIMPRVPDELPPLPCTVFGSWDPSISGNGRYVAFVSPVAFVDSDDNLSLDVYLRDLRKGTTALVSATKEGKPGNDDSGLHMGLGISRDGRYVAYETTATNLVDTGCEPMLGLPPIPLLCPENPVVVTDMKTHQTRVVGEGYGPSMSSDGRAVVFNSTKSYVPGDVGNSEDVYLYDMRTKKVELVSRNRDGGAGPVRYSMVWSTQPTSANGRFVMFTSTAKDLIPNPDNESSGAYVLDRKTGRMERVGVASYGQGFGASIADSISADGRYVAFGGSPYPEQAGACHPAAASECGGIYVHDRLTGATDPMVMNEGATAWYGAFDAAGRRMTFFSSRDDLAPDDTNETFDAFVYDRGKSMGVGGLERAAGPIRMTGRPSLGSRGVVLVADPLGERAVNDAAADLIGSRLSYIDRSDTLLVRIDVARMARVVDAVADARVLYGATLESNGVRYEIRAQRTALGAVSPGGAEFGLFRCDDSRCDLIAPLRGGYGTVGDAVVVELDPSLIGLQHGGEIEAATAFTAVGTFATGAVTTIDQIRL